MGCGGSKQATSRGGTDPVSGKLSKNSKKEKAPIGNQQIVTGTPVMTAGAQPTQMIVQQMVVEQVVIQ